MQCRHYLQSMTMDFWAYQCMCCVQSDREFKYQAAPQCLCYTHRSRGSCDTEQQRHICSAKMLSEHLVFWTYLCAFNMCVHTESQASQSKQIYSRCTHRDGFHSKAKAFKLLLDKISWQKSKILVRKPKLLVVLILATLELSQWIKTTAKIKSQNLSRLPNSAVLKHFQVYWLYRAANGEKYIGLNLFMLPNLSTVQLVRK